MIIRLLVVIAFMLICTSGIGFCEMYTWKNADGTVGCTDSYGKVPEQYRDQVEVKKYKSNDSVVNSNWEPQPRDNKRTVLRHDTTYSNDTQELSEEKKEKIDKEIRGVWGGLKDSLKRGDIK
jgi:hypothetical protein